MSMSLIINPNIGNDKSGVIAIPRCKLVQRAVLEAALKTHSELSPSDLKYAISEMLKLNLNDQDLAKFVLQIYKLSNTGRFSLTYNLDLDTHIKAKVSKRIKKLVDVSGTQKAWPELYDNPYLTPEEKESINNMYNREYYAILNTLENASSSNDFDNIIPCAHSKTDSLYLHKDEIQNVSVYSKCYDNVCISESRQNGKIVAVGNGDSIPQIAYVADGEGKNNRFCFKTMDLVKQLSKGNYINPQSNNMFTELALNQLLMKYEKEIKMYKKHLDILDKAGY